MYSALGRGCWLHRLCRHPVRQYPGNYSVYLDYKQAEEEEAVPVEKVKNRWGAAYTIEVETRTLKEVKEALDCKVHIIMLDNMDNKTMEAAVKLINQQAKTEASGNMTLDRIKGVCDTGVDYISIGALTHTVKAFDFSLIKRK